MKITESAQFICLIQRQYVMKHLIRCYWTTFYVIFYVISDPNKKKLGVTAGSFLNNTVQQMGKDTVK